MKDQKIFVGSASHRWNDPFTYAIGTTQSEVDEYLKEASIEESKNHLDACESEYHRNIVIRDWSEDMTVFEDYRGAEIPVNDNGDQIIKGSRPGEWIGNEFALFYVDLFSVELDEAAWDHCNCYLAEDITFGSYEIDSVEQFGSLMNDEEVIKLGILDEIYITSDIEEHNGKINLVASYDPFTANGFNNPIVEVRMSYMDYSFDAATATELIVYELLDEIDETLIAIEDVSIMAGQAKDFIALIKQY